MILMTQQNYADVCRCGHTLIAHVHYNGDLGLPGNVTTYCGYPSETGECECPDFALKPDGDDALLNLIRNSVKVSILSDGELIDDCLEEFSDLDITSRKDALLQEVLTRFQKAVCLEQTPKGITADGEPIEGVEVNL